MKQLEGEGATWATKGGTAPTTPAKKPAAAKRKAVPKKELQKAVIKPESKAESEDSEEDESPKKKAKATGGRGKPKVEEEAVAAVAVGEKEVAHKPAVKGAPRARGKAKATAPSGDAEATTTTNDARVKKGGKKSSVKVEAGDDTSDAEIKDEMTEDGDASDEEDEAEGGE
jgi:hypothetical protein